MNNDPKYKSTLKWTGSFDSTTFSTNTATTAPFDKNCWPGKLDFDMMWLESLTLMNWLSLAGFNVSEETI